MTKRKVRPRKELHGQAGSNRSPTYNNTYILSEAIDARLNWDKANDNRLKNQAIKL